MNILSLHHILFSHFLQVSIEYPIIVPYDMQIAAQIAALAMTRNISVVTINVTIHHKKFTENRHYPLFKEIQM